MTSRIGGKDTHNLWYWENKKQKLTKRIVLLCFLCCLMHGFGANSPSRAMFHRVIYTPCCLICKPEKNGRRRQRLYGRVSLCLNKKGGITSKFSDKTQLHASARFSEDLAVFCVSVWLLVVCVILLPLRGPMIAQRSIRCHAMDAPLWCNGCLIAM